MIHGASEPRARRRVARTSSEACLDERGSALVEALVAVTILAVASSAWAVVVRATAASRSLSETRQVAASIAHDEVERLRALDPDDLVRRIEGAASRTLIEGSVVEREGRTWRVERRLARGGSAASGPLCAGQPAADVRPVRGTVRVAALVDGEPSGSGSVLVPVAIAPRWPVAVDGALVVRVDEGDGAGTPIAGVVVAIEGPLRTGVAASRVVSTDAEGCAWLGGLTTGEYRLTLRAAERVDVRHRRAGAMPDGAAPAGGSDVTFVLGVSRGSRPALDVGLPRASSLRVEVVEPEGATARDAATTGDPDGASPEVLTWWLEDEEGASSDTIGSSRWVAPGALRVGVGACRPGGEEAGHGMSSTVVLDPGETVLHLVPLLPVVVGLAVPTPDQEGAPDPGATPTTSGPTVLVARIGPDCPAGGGDWRWTLSDAREEVLVGLPVGPVTLTLEDVEGRTLRGPLETVVSTGGDGASRIELVP